MLKPTTIEKISLNETENVTLVSKSITGQISSLFWQKVCILHTFFIDLSLFCNLHLLTYKTYRVSPQAFDQNWRSIFTQIRWLINPQHIEAPCTSDFLLSIPVKLLWFRFGAQFVRFGNFGGRWQTWACRYARAGIQARARPGSRNCTDCVTAPSNLLRPPLTFGSLEPRSPW